MIHHCYEQVEENDDVDHWVAAEHEETPEAGETFDSNQLEVVQVYEAESCPKQRLRRFK